MKKIMKSLVALSGLSIACSSLAIDVDKNALQGAALYKEHCASCHEVAASNAPTRASLGQMSATARSDVSNSHFTADGYR